LLETSPLGRGFTTPLSHSFVIFLFSFGCPGFLFFSGCFCETSPLDRGEYYMCRFLCDNIPGMDKLKTRFCYGWRGTDDIRSDLRQNGTRAEQLLWNVLKARRINGLTFRRQHGFGNWIVDFYHGTYRTVIDLDGNIHDTEEVQAFYMGRQEYLENIDCTVLLFRNEDCFSHLTTVLEKRVAHIARKEPKAP
jgi:very-short-patch-repair endonuclease